MRTKTICTIGPASDTPEIIENLAKLGMDVVRLNFSHGTHDDHLKKILLIKELNKKLDIPLAILQDIQGPLIRLGIFSEKKTLVRGQQIVLTTRDVPCDDKIMSVTYKNLPSSVKPQDRIYIADGLIELHVKDIKDADVICEVIEGGEVNSKKNVNIPHAIIDLPAITEKDKEDVLFGIQHGVDFIAQSFVRQANDVLVLKEFIAQSNADIPVLAKIESEQAIANIDAIIAVADGIMVARGDLGVSLEIEQLPHMQKMIIKKCNAAGKPVIVATQMLESMIKNPRPTRAEITDIANAVFDGADCLMLSGETAAGLFPLRALEVMCRIAEQAEKEMEFHGFSHGHNLTVQQAIGRAVCQAAHDVNASAIITCTFSGSTAKIISQYRPKTTIFALTPNETELRRLNLWWGVHPLAMAMPEDTDDLIEKAVAVIHQKGLVQQGKTVIVAAGIPFSEQGITNLLKVHVV
ncbi:MAG: pyruvate kinase [archaeon]